MKLMLFCVRYPAVKVLNQYKNDRNSPQMHIQI